LRRRRLRLCRAVSSIIATMLMITITLSLAAILVTWAGTSFGGFAGGSQLYFVQRQQALEEQFAIENVFFTKSQGYIDIFVRNVGASLVSVVAIYVDNIPEPPTGASRSNGGIASCTIPGGTPTTPPGLVLGTTSSTGSTCTTTPNVVDFNVQLPNGFNANCPAQPWCSGDIFYIVVASGKGNQATYSVGAP
jgi:FlaG/FlaF family flagellin (archaellin)